MATADDDASSSSDATSRLDLPLAGGATTTNTAEVGPLPEGLRIEPDPDSTSKDVTYDEVSNTVRIPLGLLSDTSKRRSKLVLFTCKPCGHRTARMVNPLAMERGLVFAQCAGCGAWHNLAANNPKLYEEIRYDKEEADSDSAASEQTDV
jgi:hypothetical protein